VIVGLLLIAAVAFAIAEANIVGVVIAVALLVAAAMIAVVGSESSERRP